MAGIITRTRGTVILAEEVGVAAETDFTDPSVYLFDPGWTQDLVAEIRATKNGGTSFDGELLDSFDSGETWTSLMTFTQLTADGDEALDLPREPGNLIKFRRTSVGDGWDYRVTLCHSPLRGA